MQRVPLYQRVYRCSFLDLPDVSGKGSTLSPVTNNMYTMEQTAEGLGFRLRFEIKKSDNLKTNQAKIKIYNPEDALVSWSNSKNPSLSLECGYANIDDYGGKVLQGSLEMSDYYDDGVDKILDLMIAETSAKYSEIQFKARYPANTFASSVANEVVDWIVAFNPHVDSYIVNFNPSFDYVYPKERLWSGNALDVLNKVIAPTNHKAFISNGKIVVMPVDPKLTTVVQPFVLVNIGNGLIGLPQKVMEKDGKKATTYQLKVRCLLNPKIDIGTRVQVAAKNLTQPFNGVVVSMTIDGDSFQGDWITDFVLESVEDPKNAQYVRTFSG